MIKSVKIYEWKAISEILDGYVCIDDIWPWPSSDSIWVPDDYESLQLRNAIIKYTGSVGCQGVTATKHTAPKQCVRKRFQKHYVFC